MANGKYEIKKMPRNKQDERMKMCRYRVNMPDGTTFECIRYDSWPNHVHFYTHTQFAVDGDILDNIEKDIILHDRR